MDSLQRMNAACNHPANFLADAVSTRRSPRHLLRKASLILLATSTFLVSFQPAAPVSVPVGHAQSHDSIHNQFEPYVEYVNEFTERRRLKVYFNNEQSIFFGAQVSYVNVGRGNLTFVRRDLVNVGRIPLVMARVYDSNLSGGDDFGRGWHLSAAETIKREPDGSITLMTESAIPVRFISLNNRFILSKPHPTDIVDLRQIDPRRFQSRLRTGFLKEYTLTGALHRLTRVQDKNGNWIALEYHSGRLAQIRGQNGRSISIERDSAGRIVAVKDNRGRRVSYNYNNSGLLVKVIDLGGNHWTYEYDNSGRLSQAINPLHHIDLAILYEQQGRVTEVRGSGQTFRYRYEIGTGRTIVTDGNGYESVYSQNEDGITTAITNPLGVQTSLLLDTNNNVQRLYRNGALQSEMDYDNQGRLVSLTNYDGERQAQVTYSYDEFGRLVEIRDADNPIAFRYDEQGNLLEKTSQEGRTRYSYSPNGDLLTVNSASGENLQFEVDSDGQITSVTDTHNRQTRFRYHSDGKLSQVRFADGSNRVYQYDPLGMRRLRQFSDGARVEYTYNPAGSLTEIRVTDKDGTTEGQRLTLDEEQKVRVVERLGGDKTYLTYDRMGNLTAVTMPGRVLKFSYDHYNRLTEVIPPGGERLIYQYAATEPDLRLQMDHHTGQAISERVTSGLTFSSGFELLRNRTEGVPFAVVKYDPKMADYRLASEFGVVVPDETQQGAIARIRVMELGESTYEYKKSFDAPSNVMFIPAEYWAVNCCPICVPPSGDGFVDPCPPCEPTGDIIGISYIAMRKISTTPSPNGPIYTYRRVDPCDVTCRNMLQHTTNIDRGMCLKMAVPYGPLGCLIFSRILSNTTCVCSDTSNN